VWVDVTGTGRTCEEVAEHLLEAAGVATVPGSAFGEFGDGYIRISYANSLERLREAVARMQKAL
jgi:aspartate/methionine/tyrosine aminotransferase